MKELLTFYRDGTVKSVRVLEGVSSRQRPTQGVPHDEGAPHLLPNHQGANLQRGQAPAGNPQAFHAT